MLGGCTLYSGGDDAPIAPDAAVMEPDAAPTLPTCRQLECPTGSPYLDCPRTEDTSVCYCDVPTDAPTTHPVTPGWCFNR